MCVCGQPATHDPRFNEFLLECHYCANWYHGRCIHVSEMDAMDIVKYACPPCTKQGHMTLKYHDSTPMEQTDDYSYAPLPIQRHRFEANNAPSYSNTSYSFHSSFGKNTEPFRRSLRAAVFARSGVRAISPHEFGPSYFKFHPFHEPLLVVDGNATIAGLTRQLPVIGLQDISALLTNTGSTVRGIDVASQESFKLSASGWTSRISHPSPDAPLTAQFRVLETVFRREVAPPIPVTEVDWHYMLPGTNGGASREPNPELYGTLCGAGAFFDFTISPDCKATWLAVSNGEIDVFLIEPTLPTIDAFRDWREDVKIPFSSVFLADRVDRCTKITVKGGATLLLPSGWIYAVYSEQGGSFFTGYFANTLNLPTLLNVWQRLEGGDARLTPHWIKTSFPHGWILEHPSPAMAPPPPLNAQLWSLVCHYINEFSHMDGLSRLSSHERHALRSAFPFLRQWGSTSRSIERLDNVSWLPATMQDAASLIDQLEQAMLSHPSSHVGDPNAAAKVAPAPSLSPSETSYLYSTPNEDELWNSGAVSSAFSTVSPGSYHQESTTTNSNMWDYSTYHDSPHGHPHSNGPGIVPGNHTLDGLSVSTDPHMVSSSFYHSPGMGDNAQFPGSLHGNTYSPNAHSFGDYLDPRTSPNGSHLGLISGSGSLLDMGNGISSMLHDAHVRHRASCHRCGNLRKKNVRCPKCPHIFCQKCAEKMVEEHGDSVFSDGCPVCKELCCCGKNRTMMCTRKFHCYKKCPATKRQPT